jgi:putative ABC transport system permease protein
MVVPANISAQNVISRNGFIEPPMACGATAGPVARLTAVKEKVILRGKVYREKNTGMNFRLALRSLRRSPGFAAAAIVTLLLGIGAVSAVFSVVNSVLLKPLAGIDTGRLVRLSESTTEAYVRPRTYREWRKLADLFEDVGANQFCQPTLNGAGEPQRLVVPCVTASWFSVYKTRALLGRTFLPDEDQPGHSSVAVLSYGFWIRQFGADRQILGRVITLDQKRYTIVGVMPKDFLPFGKATGDLYLPWVMAENEVTFVDVTARLRPGVTTEVRAAIQVVLARLTAEFPNDYKGAVAVVTPLLETRVGPQRALLRLLLAAAGCLLLIAVVNAANLFLARGAAKQRETSIRAYLGASRLQLLAPRFAESALISAAGSAGGLLAAWGITRLIVVRLESLPRAEEVAVDARVVLVALLITVFAVFVCGAAPLWSRKRASGGALMILEVTLTFVLLTCSGLLIRSFEAMRNVPLGYDPQGVILGAVSQPEDPHDSREAAVVLWRRVRERAAALPDVSAVATSTATPTGGMGLDLPVIRPGEDVDKLSNAPERQASVAIVSGDYFRVMGIALRAGRTFTDRDNAGAPEVAIVSQSVADRFLGENAIGKRIEIPRFGFNITSIGAVTPREIVGVVADVKEKSVADAGQMGIYLPDGQAAARFTHILARARQGDPMRLERELRDVIYQEAPKLAVAPMLTLDQANDYLIRAPRQAMWLVGAFALLALSLAGVGVHGVVAYAAVQRTREMGIRMALGARPAQLFSLIASQAIRLALIGAALGIAAAYAATRLLESLLFGVARSDAASYLSGLAILLGIALAAACGPALRAARTDPSITLRAE